MPAAFGSLVINSYQLNFPFGVNIAIFSEIIIHCGDRIDTAASEAQSTALERLVAREDRLAVGRPRILGFAETLYLRTGRGAAVYDVSAPAKPREIQTLSSQGWFENTATSRNLMARYDPQRHAVDLYEVADRHTL